MNFELPQKKQNKSIIKVIGIGGGGGNAVEHMYQQGIKGVDFLLINTDAQALDDKTIPDKLLIGEDLTQGNGVGSNPDIARLAAENAKEAIIEHLSNGTKMLFLAAGLGKGTGTGATPVIARIAKEMKILTVGIVTTPFKTEGRPKKLRALEGLKTLYPYLDSVMVIDNDNLTSIFKDLSADSAFSQSDEVLAGAAKGIADLITIPGKINVDFQDVRTALYESGIALMGSAMASGPNRAEEVVKLVLNAPLLKENNIDGAAHILLNISYNPGEYAASMQEIAFIEEYIQQETGYEAELTKGTTHDVTLGESIKLTVVVTGFADKGGEILSNLEASLSAMPIRTKIVPPSFETEKKIESVEPIAQVSRESNVKRVQEQNIIPTPTVQPTPNHENHANRWNSRWTNLSASLQNSAQEIQPEGLKSDLSRVEENMKKLNGYYIPTPEEISSKDASSPETPKMETPKVEDVVQTPIQSIPVPEQIIQKEETPFVEPTFKTEQLTNEFPIFNRLDEPSESANRTENRTEDMVQPTAELPLISSIQPSQNTEITNSLFNETPKETIPEVPLNANPINQRLSIPKEPQDANLPKVENTFKPVENTSTSSQSYLNDDEMEELAKNVKKYHEFNIDEVRMKNQQIATPHGIKQIENTPAFERKKIILEPVESAEQKNVGTLSSSISEDGAFIHKKENPYYDPNVD